MAGKHNVYNLLMLYFPHRHHRRRRSTRQHDFWFIGDDGTSPVGTAIYLCNTNAIHLILYYSKF